MKNYAPLFIAIASIFCLNCYAQRNSRTSNIKKNAQLLAERVSDNDLAVVSYHVEERINMNFGSTITTYDVSNANLISTTDLGQNNTRIVTPKFGKAKVGIVVVIAAQPQAIVKAMMPVGEPMKFEIIAPAERKDRYVDIDKVATYERILERGYKSIDMFRKVGDRRFFAGDLAIAAKWYAELFSMTTDFEPVYYYRYAASLKAIGENEKAQEMMAIFESKNSNP